MSVTTTPTLSMLIAPYRMTATDKERLSLLLAHAYLEAKYTAYQRAASTASRYVRVRSPWRPTAYDAQQATQWATGQVAGIAETYETLLEHAVVRLLPQERLFGGFGDGIKEIARGIADWFKGFIGWKSEQIANVTESTGDYDGTMQWIQDVQEDAEIEGDPSVQDVSNLVIEVYPDSSSSDFCQDWAGKRFPLDAAGDVPQFPVHANCIHKVRIIDEGQV